MRTLFAFLLACATAFAYQPNLSKGFQADVPTLMDGVIADPSEFPAVVWIGNCTAAVVGPNVVATAAHCTGSRNISFSLGNTRYRAQCVGSNYRSNSTNDYALCFTRDTITAPYYENMASDPDVVSRRDWVLLSGFGCTRWGGRLDMRLRVGKAQVLGTPSGRDNDYTTGNGATLCSGDSGGPAWSLDKNDQRLLVISTNSRSNTRDRSYLSSWVSQDGKAHIARFRQSFPQARICGLDQNVPNCRNAAPEEPVEFQVESDEVLLDVVLQPGSGFEQEVVRERLQMILN